MPKISAAALREVQDALEQYRNEVEISNLKHKTKKTYIRHSGTFVRWLNDDFTPGINVGRR